jgi:hypothetical protein
MELVVQSKDEALKSKDEALKSKDEALQSKERDMELVVQSKDGFLKVLEDNINRIEAERDFLKGTLDARHIFETYEAKFKKPDPKGPKLTRAGRWDLHLALNPNILKKLEECNQDDKKIVWPDKAVEIYDQLCRNIHQRTIEIGNGKYIVMIEKSLPKTSSCFVKVLAKELYGENVSVKEYILGVDPLETEPSSV